MTARLTEDILKVPGGWDKTASPPWEALGLSVGAWTPIEARFWAKVKKTPTCWLWTGAIVRHGGHGQFHIARDQSGRARHIRTNRLAWMLRHGAIPDGLDVCHHCDVPACVRVEHLFLGTARDNLQDASRKGRLGGPRNGVLTLADRLAIYDAPRAEWSGVALARRYGVTEGCISLIRRGRFVGSGVSPAPTLHGSSIKGNGSLVAHPNECAADRSVGR